MVLKGTLYTPKDYHRSWRTQIAALYSGAQLKIENFVIGKTDTEKSFLSKFPPSTVPVFENDQVCLFEVNAIAYYLGTDELRGGKYEYLVTQWVNFADNNVLPAVATWVYPYLGISKSEQNIPKTKSYLASILKFLNEKLSTITFLVGDRISLADITLFTDLYLLFTHVYGEKDRREIPHVMRWYDCIANQPNVKKVVGTAPLCGNEAKVTPKKVSEVPKKERVKNESSKTASSQPSNDLDKKEKDALLALPAGKFNLDEFKRTFSNESSDTAISYFWKHFDPEAYSIWTCDYLYRKDLTLLFMTSNLVMGFYQRLERMRKLGFGILCIFGQNNDNYIKGLWIWRGTGLIFDLSPDLQTDYESYRWTKLDHNSEEAKQTVSNYFKQTFSNETLYDTCVYK